MTEFGDIFAYDITTTVYLSISAAMMAVYALAILASVWVPAAGGLTLARAG